MMTHGRGGDESAKTEGQSQKYSIAHSSLKHWRPKISCIPYHFHSHLQTITIKVRLYYKNKARIKSVNFHMSVLK